MPLRTCLMRTLPAVMVSLAVFFGPRVLHQTCVLGMGDRLLRLGARAIANARHFDATLTSDLLDGRQLLKSIKGRQHHVVRIGRAQALGENVGDAGALHDRAHRATSNYTGAGSSGLHENSARPVRTDNLVRN